MKTPLTSKMIWVNALTLTVGLIGYTVGQEWIQDNSTLVSILVAVQGAVNIVLRFVTSEPIV